MSQYVYRFVRDGTPANLQADLPGLEADNIPEGGLAEIRLEFKTRFPGFENVAISFDKRLRNNHGVLPWPGAYQVVYVDPAQPVWYIRYEKGLAWAIYIVAALVAIAAILIIMRGWKFFSVVAKEVDKNPWMIPVVLVGSMGLLLVNQLVQLRRPKGG